MSSKKELYALFHKENLIGLYNDYNDCQIMIMGLVNNKFAIKTNLSIKTFYTNTITNIEYNKKPVNNIIIEEFSPDVSTDDDDDEFENLNSEEKEKVINKMRQDLKKNREINEEKQKIIDEEEKNRSEIQFSINKLKKEKEKIEESKRVYDVDITIFNKFKQMKQDNSNFIIPDMFIDKYDLMIELENENKLCWDNFHELYKPKKMETSYSKLFDE